MARRQRINSELWSQTSEGWTSGHNGWGLHVWFDDNPFFGPPVWEWSAMRFLHPEDETDDRILALGGQAETKAEAMADAMSAAEAR